ncbi:helix-turn-helix transcriptional regulator [Cryptosporangium aurantiacum]|uniref:Proteasome accessory factor C n=1 Tax=Cryptosporangium aurantiacum TaxID=134849 RepID=A0A1M7RIT9_9ACTN|nr:WYL domain-containing protein [Cryptosporangium aurantiacum]SHN46069.1 proteasome accessory factor C [Cryptosporangium aurantiacum]
MSSAGSERLARLLALVPYLQARPGALISEVAADHGVSEKQLRDDLQLLFVCGLPGYGPGDLIDMSLDDDTVTLTYHAELDRPLRLTADEALALIVALRALEETPGVDGAAVGRALAKVERAAGEAGRSAKQVAITGGYEDTGMAARVRGALERGRALRIVYYTAGRDATSERVIDPMRLLVVDGRGYLEAWCRRAEAVRMFRIDRIDALDELDEPSVPARGLAGSDGGFRLSDGAVFEPPPDSPLVTLRVGLGSRWVTEYYPCEDVRPEDGGTWLVTLKASDLEWARRLVMGLGEDAEVVGPAELVELVRSEARAALAAYTG